MTNLDDNSASGPGDPALSALLEQLARADRNSAPRGLEARIADATMPLRLAGQGPARVSAAIRWGVRFAVAAALALAAGAAWYAARPPQALTPTVATANQQDTPANISDTAEFVLAIAFGESGSDLATISAETEALGERVRRTISPEDAFLTDGAS